ncbi:MAG: preprotein translocase subunit SecG [Pirellulaceae bacterium]
MTAALFGILLFVTALFLILLVLVQRGRGGGLSGALGGMGGQSAFGTKAGDLFTRITIVVATVWILLCILAILVLNRQVIGTRDASGEGVEYTKGVVERLEDGDKPASTGGKSVPPGSSNANANANAKAVPAPSPQGAPAGTK